MTIKGLGGATKYVHFYDVTAMVAAAEALLRCHPHHFAVLADENTTLVVSPGALECLRAGGFMNAEATLVYEDEHE